MLSLGFGIAFEIAMLHTNQRNLNTREATMKKQLLIIASLIIMAGVWMSCNKTYIVTTENRIATYWSLDQKTYDDYDARTGQFLGSQTVVFQGDSHYNFGRDGYYDGVEITNGNITQVGGRYTIVDRYTIIMDYDGYSNENIEILLLTNTEMQLKLTYIKDGIETDETLYFYR